ncbi:M20/M25/M40 family metallo-hydrolase [Candidatus Micrarchaeota archaeon]|nr:M20/M25/M40 family metallo-hydrolase [Candidatus Micrarchaeota archaeon]
MRELETLEELVSINSVFPNEAELGACLETRLKELGFSVRRQHVSENRFNVIGERGDRGAPVLFYGHMDTVPPYGKWSSDPFELSERNGRLQGLGAYDMKAGIGAMLCALQESTDRKLRVAFGVDEENDSAGAWKLFREGILDDVEGIVTTEIGDTADESLGTRTITLGRRGRAVYEFRVPGRSIHGAHSRGQENAVSQASRLAIALEEMNSRLPGHEVLPRPTQFVSRIHSEATSLSTPEEAVLVVDRHLVTPETPESVLQVYKSFLEELYSGGRLEEANGRAAVRIRPRENPYLMPYVTPGETRFAQEFAGAVRKEAGEPVFNYGHSVADECILASTGIPLVTLPPVGGNEHQADEWVSRSSYLRMAAILRKFISSL